MRVRDAHRSEGKMSLMRASDIVRMAEHSLFQFDGTAPQSFVSVGTRMARRPARAHPNTVRNWYQLPACFSM